MVAKVGDVVRALPWIDRAVVSTDHDEIASVAEAAGLAAPFRRPSGISGDTVSDTDVLTHALYETERLDRVTYDVILMLQPTSPLRKPEDVQAAVAMLVDGGWDAVWTVSETDSKAHPLKQMVVGGSGELDYYDQAGSTIIARQQLRPVYHRNGIAYAISRECLLEQRGIKGTKTGAYVVPGQHVSIDTEWDIALVEYILRGI